MFFRQEPEMCRLRTTMCLRSSHHPQRSLSELNLPRYFSKVEGACDSIPLVCNLSIGPCVTRLCELFATGKRRTAQRTASDRTLKVRSRDGEVISFVRVEHDPLRAKNGNIYTSAGVSVGVDPVLGWLGSRRAAEGAARGYGCEGGVVP